jgi:uncharacterized protein (TIGR01440 family)
MCDAGKDGGQAVVNPQSNQIEQEILSCLEDLESVANLGPRDLLVIGASSSEVVGKRIGTSTSLDIGRTIVNTVLSFAGRHGFDVAFQCCEHLNRALVVERDLALLRGYTIVSAVPIPGAGGAVAAEAFGAFQDPCLVERISAEAGIDLGDTFIGMHLRRVAVPVRPRCSSVGAAHVTMARTRPPLIGGSRAVYDKKDSPVWRRGAKS